MTGREIYGNDLDLRHFRAVVSKARDCVAQVSLVREYVSNEHPEESTIVGVSRVTTHSGDESLVQVPVTSKQEVPNQEALKLSVGTQIFQLSQESGPPPHDAWRMGVLLRCLNFTENKIVPARLDLQANKVRSGRACG